MTLLRRVAKRKGEKPSPPSKKVFLLPDLFLIKNLLAELNTLDINMNTNTMTQHPSFPNKLMALLDGAAPEALWWLPGNQSFAIDTEKFVAWALDKFFQGAKYTTFVRKLNQW